MVSSSLSRSIHRRLWAKVGWQHALESIGHVV